MAECFSNPKVACGAFGISQSDMTAYVDALRQQITKQSFPELVAISHESVIRGRVARIANFVESQLVMIRRCSGDEPPTGLRHAVPRRSSPLQRSDPADGTRYIARSIGSNTKNGQLSRSRGGCVNAAAAMFPRKGFGPHMPASHHRGEGARQVV